MNLSGVLNDDDIEALRARNEARSQAAVEALGNRWLLAEANRVRRGVHPLQASQPPAYLLRQDRLGDRVSRVAVLRRPKYGVAR